jgi:hypothetical protein
MKHFIFVVLFFFANQIISQTLNGIIVNEQNTPIPEAHILNKKNKNSAYSNQNGEFSILDISIGDTLKISHINYKIKEVIIENFSPITITLNETIVSLEEVVIGKKLNALNVFSVIDTQIKPVDSSQDILQQVPGLIIGQHAGGGKAEQIFLRGFDIDHGTDITLNVDGLPVNMVSHTHGQGYADLHFVIPETVKKIDFGKGPYYANKGNFNTAGYVEFKTKNRLQSSKIKLDIGEFDTQRLLGMFNLINNKKHSAYIASEFIKTDGYFESSQNFNRLNILGKYIGSITEKDKFGITISHFDSKWDASGQIPQRLVNNRLITRFGAVDDTEGGNTSRTNLILNFDKAISENSSIKSKLFYSIYDFELYSNFTFFLDDPIYGDQIKQKETRNIFGFISDYKQKFTNIDSDFSVGVSLRNDKSKENELSHTANRSTTINQIQIGDVNETNLGVYASANFNFGKFVINPALRLDYFNFEYNDELQPNYRTQSETGSVISPKLNVLFNYNNNLQLYAKAGKGFHSNDIRVVIAQNGKDVLPSAYGFDLGFIWKPVPKLLINTAYWYLFLEQEFVYVGDAGIVEPSGKTRRQGVDFSIRYEPINSLYVNLDANYSHARATEKIEGKNYIPLAPDFTLTSGLTYKLKSSFWGGLQLKHINNRPANEDNSIIAEGYTVTDLNIGYQYKNVTFGLQIQNIFDTEWNETQFATESRLQNEINSVEEIHFTPGTPLFLKGSVSISF